MALISDFTITSPIFIQFTYLYPLRHFNDITKHYILSEHFLGKNDSEEEENDEEHFQLLYFFNHIFNRRISRFPKPFPSQICK